MNMDLIEFGWLLSHVVFLICRLKMRCLICLLIAAMIGWAGCTADADAQVNEQADVDRPEVEVGAKGIEKGSYNKKSFMHHAPVYRYTHYHRIESVQQSGESQLGSSRPEMGQHFILNFAFEK
ncbi:hypothetical protein OUZ56_013653 [Daphnia magna]|uniref:Uncharacterized protein n=1 Tax=Daphnia magna TaxID=35525 RepID=A0ABQ9Z6I9_9CRUS|nr:hypothetical protein OUZ56_013653 [Daphnia magna]